MITLAVILIRMYFMTEDEAIRFARNVTKPKYSEFSTIIGLTMITELLVEFVHLTWKICKLIFKRR